MASASPGTRATDGAGGGWSRAVVASARFPAEPERGRDALPWDRDLTSGCAVVICTRGRSNEVARFLDSIARQSRMPEEVIIVDASEDAATQDMLTQRDASERLACPVFYHRVRDPLRGLTRQRNFGLRCATRQFVAFFDDDMVLDRDCLGELAATLDAASDMVGVSGVIENEAGKPSLLWRLRRWLRIVPSLRPGSYSAAGMAVSWNFLAPTEEIVDGDWLCGCAMYRTELARHVRFTESFGGYCNGEDVDFSVRMRKHGRLGVVGRARMRHLRAGTGRPNAFGMRYWTVRNLHDVHRRCIVDRRWWHAARFFYAFGMDTLVRAAGLVYPAAFKPRFLFVCGRLRFFAECLGLRELPPTCGQA